MVKRRGFTPDYPTGAQQETPSPGVRVFDTGRISGKKLVLTLLIFGLNKW